MMGGRRMLPRWQNLGKVGPTCESTRPPSTALMVLQHIVSTHTLYGAVRNARASRIQTRTSETGRQLSIVSTAKLDTNDFLQKQLYGTTYLADNQADLGSKQV